MTEARAAEYAEAGHGEDLLCCAMRSWQLLERSLHQHLEASDHAIDASQQLLDLALDAREPAQALGYGAFDHDELRATGEEPAERALCFAGGDVGMELRVFLGNVTRDHFGVAAVGLAAAPHTFSVATQIARVDHKHFQPGLLSHVC